ncbi:sphingomyelin phosphodiesterase-like isoform X3 [Sitophilus oryzae]|uniref:Sphingomyelin phosphodiesterase-like isoform X3 n=1 Tax=Sitophilus oryzae TaxID=7048 RepID=A0A6J2YAF2_SITOR|nr:sphingomyelin phosphodiesterase-like isoform X3 [Sitophilus oryzae]
MPMKLHMHLISLQNHFQTFLYYLAIGNHESIPLNMFAPPEISDPQFSQSWLYELIAKLWAKWLPPEATSTVEKQGYYSVLANKKLRIIVLNNNVCYIFNWWLLYDTYFLQQQIEFMKKELLEAEANGQFVHIIAHVFPGEKECIEPWEVNYNSLITRFSHIIKGQFFGHTHTDGLKVFYSKIDGTPNNVGFNGASLTPYTKYNPNYKILSVDPNTFDILDVETYFFNLTEANLHPDRTPRWTRLYSLKEAYSFPDLSPENFDWLAKNLPRDSYLFDMYWRFYVRNGDASLKEGCNNECRKKLIESITTTEPF